MEFMVYRSKADAEPRTRALGKAKTGYPRKWPPLDAVAFVRSDWFTNCVEAVANDLQRSSRHLDLMAAVGQVWDWFDRRARKEPEFFASGRFSNPGALKAYVRQALWRSAADAVRREKRRHRYISELPLNYDPAGNSGDTASAAEISSDWRSRIKMLPWPENLVVEAIVFGEMTLRTAGRRFGISEAEVMAAFDRGIDRLSFSKGSRAMTNPKRKRGRRGQMISQAIASATPTPCEANYLAQGVSTLGAKILCGVWDCGKDPIVVASELDIEIDELNAAFDVAIDRLGMGSH